MSRIEWQTLITGRISEFSDTLATFKSSLASYLV